VLDSRAAVPNSGTVWTPSAAKMAMHYHAKTSEQANRRIASSIAFSVSVIVMDHYSAAGDTFSAFSAVPSVL